MKHYQESCRDLYDMLQSSAEKYPDKPAVIDDDENISYREMKRRVDILADALLDRFGLRAGQQAGILMVNSAKTLVTFYALARIGCIAVMMNTKYRKKELEDLIEDMDIRLIVTDERWLDKVTGASEKGGITLLTAARREPFFEVIRHGGQMTAALTDKKTIPVTKMGETAESSGHPEEFRNADLDSHADDPVVIMHTSGTTGKPKGIMITQRNIMEAAYGYRDVQGLGPDDVTVLSVPLFHILGLSCVSTLFIWMGATIVLSEFYKAEDVLRKIKKYRATHFHSVPAIYLQLLHTEDPEKDLSSIRTAICGGAPVRQEDVEAICRMMPNAVFRRAYGMTETAGSGTLSAEHKGALMAVPNMYCTVVDENHHELPPGTMGEIVFHGAPVARGRWKAEDLPDDNMYSGDVGWMDEAGHIYVEDRVKDIINRGGEKIFPMKIEAMINHFPGISRSAVYAVFSEKYGEEPAVSVIAEEGETPDLDGLKTYLKERIASFEMPVRFEIRESFPVTQNGKIRKTALRAEMEQKTQQTAFTGDGRKETGSL